MTMEFVALCSVGTWVLHVVGHGVWGVGWHRGFWLGAIMFSVMLVLGWFCMIP